jgi:hypothetical protein
MAPTEGGRTMSKPPTIHGAILGHVSEFTVSSTAMQTRGFVHFLLGKYDWEGASVSCHEVNSGHDVVAATAAARCEPTTTHPHIKEA